MHSSPSCLHRSSVSTHGCIGQSSSAIPVRRGAHAQKKQSRPDRARGSPKALLAPLVNTRACPRRKHSQLATLFFASGNGGRQFFKLGSPHVLESVYAKGFD